ncbi:hypothetical protein SCNRRL3882_5224 [Streptomyces chartreusis NRRL 3882]|uniref:Uncharacterized protein n=1 Tax=Streptomyces chartreusis NRRL 3882 TaxID=1079985 RepID=A0A2N9BEH5_STRCX|nr:hypothetical protein SCNRRL3882_5224 [Streptomyces chartreusis NRRL 3882]
MVCRPPTSTERVGRGWADRTKFGAPLFDQAHCHHPDDRAGRRTFEPFGTWKGNVAVFCTHACMLGVSTIAGMFTPLRLGKFMRLARLIPSPGGACVDAAHIRTKGAAPADIAARPGIAEGDLCVRTSYEFVVLPEGGPHAGAGVVKRMAAIGVTVSHAVEQPGPLCVHVWQAVRAVSPAVHVATVARPRTTLPSSDHPWAVSGPCQGARGRPTATGSDRRVPVVQHKGPGQSPRTIRVSTQGWRYGKMGCICPLPYSSCRTVSLG